MKKEIPNILTLCNLLCGAVSVILVFSAQLYWASLLILFAAVFDLFDGMVARWLKVSGPMGGELDSLADVVSFGIAPSFMAYNMMFSQTGRLHAAPHWLCFAVLLMAAASAYRLAKFNVDPAQRESFKGLPTPANALLWASLTMHWVKKGVVLNGWFVLVLALLMAFLLICNFRMFSFKIHDWRPKAQLTVYIYLAVSVLSVCLLGFLGLAVDVLLYPCFSYIHFRFDKTE